MAVFTELNKALISRLLAGYDLGELVAYEAISSGIENTNYFIWTKKADLPEAAWVLTIFENLPECELPFFNRLTRCLYDLGFHVPAPQCLNNGADYFHLTAEELNQAEGKFGVIVPRFAGSAQERPALQACEQIAEYMARMHVALVSFPALKNIDHDHGWFDSRVQWLRQHVSATDAELLGTAWQRYQSYVDSLNACTSGIVHGDLFRDNVLFDKQGISGVIDFYHAGFSPLMFDLAVVANDWAVLSDTDAGQKHNQKNNKKNNQEPVYDESKLEAILQAYSSVRPLTQKELDLWPRFLELAAFRFWLSRLNTQHRPGYQQGIKQGNCLKSPDEKKRILLAAMLR